MTHQQFIQYCRDSLIEMGWTPPSSHRLEPSHQTIYGLFYRFRKSAYKEKGWEDDKASRLANMDAVQLTGDLFNYYHNPFNVPDACLVTQLQRWDAAATSDEAKDIIKEVPWIWKVVPVPEVTP